MRNPFGAFIPTPEEPETKNRIVLKCRVCQQDVARSDWQGGGMWVHLSDMITLIPGGATITSQYDHEADPDVIDVEVVDE